MKDSIVELMSDILKISTDKLVENFDSKDIWDSLTRVEILFAIEEEFDVTFDSDELVDLATPQLLCESVIARCEE